MIPFNNELKTFHKELELLTENGLMDIFEKCLALFDADLFERPRGIHGLNHMQRVLLHSLNLARVLELDRLDTRILAIASMYHDIGRINEWEDTAHGDMGYTKTKRNYLLEAEDVQLGLGKLYREDKHIIEFLIRHHCRSDETIMKKLQKVPAKEKGRTEKLVKIFKDSDGIDRVRLGDLDIRYLRFPETVERVPFAEKLLNIIPIFG